LTLSKIINKEKLEQLRSQSSVVSQKIVFTNGCFDILHPGHLDLLKKAKSLGNVLVVGVNDDASITRLKGANRPIHTLTDRMTMLAGLSSTDYIIPFSEDTPYNLIIMLNPDVLVKGGDYTIDTIVGAEDVIQNGGRVEIIDILDNYSTSSIIEKIKKS